MFSSISKYTSPKQLLASYLSKSLAEFFDVNPNDVVTNLLTNAKVALHNISIKEQYHGQLKVYGSVDTIEFSWAWGTQSLISDVKLKVEGVKLHVKVCSTEEAQQQKQEQEQQVLALTPVAPETGAAPPDWKTRYLNQIIDCLTLVIRDVHISIHMGENDNDASLSSSQIHLQGRNIELHTTHQEQTGALTQRLKMGSIEAWIVVADNNSTTISSAKKEQAYPILDPFGYHATVQRVSGRRFLDGILSGLFVQGDVEPRVGDAPSAIRVHAGIKQIAGLICLQEVLLSLKANAACGQEAETNSGDTNDEIIPIDTSEKNSKDNANPTVFCLPVQSMEVVLENQTTLRLAGCTLRYCVDGTQLSVDCTRGIWMNETPLSQNNRWVLDLMANELVLDVLHEEDDVFFDAKSCVSALTTGTHDEAVNDDDGEHFIMELTVDMLEKLHVGMQAVLPQCNRALELAESVMESPSPPFSTPTVPWTTRVNGSVAFRFTGRDPSEWLEFSADYPKIVKGENALSFDCKSMRLSSESGGTSTIEIPSVQTIEGKVHVQESIQVTVGSTESISMLRRLASQVTDVIGDTGGSGSVELPVDVLVSSVGFVMDGPKGIRFKANEIYGSGLVWNVLRVEAAGLDGMAIHASGIKGSFEDGCSCLLVETVEQLTIQNVNCLTAPLQKTKVTLKDDTLDLQFKSLKVNSLKDLAALKQDVPGNPTTTESSFPISMNVTMTCDDLHIPLDAEKHVVQIQGAKCAVHAAEISPDPLIKAEFRSLKGCLGTNMKFVLAHVLVQARCLPGGGSPSGQSMPFEIPGVGTLASATVRVGELSELHIPLMGYLEKPVTDIKVDLDSSDKKATFSAKSLHFRCLEVMQTDTLESSKTGGSNLHILNLPIDVTANVDTVCCTFDEHKSIEVQDVGCILRAACDGASNRSSTEMHFGSITAQKEIGTRVSCTKVEARAYFEAYSSAPPDTTLATFAIPGLGSLSTAALRVGEISEFSIALVGQLAKSTTDVSVDFCRGKATIHLNSVLVQYPGLFKKGEPGDALDSQHSFHQALALSVDIAMTRLMVMPVFGAGKPGVCFDGVCVSLAGQETPSSVKLSASSHYFQGRGPAEQSLGVAKELKMEAVLTDHGVNLGHGLRLQRAVGSVGEVSSLKIPGVVELCKPLSGLNISFHDDLVQVECDELDMVNFVAGSTSEQSQSEPTQNLTSGSVNPNIECQPLRFPVSIRFRINKLSAKTRIKIAEPTDQSFCVKGDQFQVDLVSAANEDNSLTIQLASNTLQVSDKSSVFVIANRLNAFAKWRQKIQQSPVDESLLRLLSTPRLGMLAFASIEIDELKELNHMGVVSLDKPLHRSKFTFKDNTLACILNSVHIKATVSGSDTSPSDGSVSTTFKVPRALFRVKYLVTIKSLNVNLNLESRPQQQISIQGARLDFRPTSVQGQNTLLLCCDRIEDQDRAGLSFSSTGLAFQMWLSQTLGLGDGENIFLPSDVSIEKGNLTLKSITCLAVPGGGMLLGTIDGTNIQYGKDGLCFNVCDDVEWALMQFDQPVLEGTVVQDTSTHIPIAASAPLGSGESYFESLNFPVKIVLKTLKVENHRDSIVLGVKGADALICADPFDNSTRITINCGVLKLETTEIANAVAKGVVANAILLPTGIERSNGLENQHFSFQGIGCVPSGSLHIEEISSFKILGIASLLDPMKGLNVQYDGTKIACICKSVVARRNVSTQPTTAKSTVRSQSSLPCNLSAAIDHIVFEDVMQSGQVCRKVNIDGFTCLIEPAIAKITAKQQGPGATLYGQFKMIESTDAYSKTRVPNVTASGLIQLGDFDTIGNLVVGCNAVELSADFTKWKTSESDTQASSHLALPFAMVGAFELNLHCTGPLVKVSDAKLSCEDFKGDARTSLETVQSHYVGIVKGRIPYLLTKANIAGSNIGDSISMVASTVVTRSNVVGATVGIAARDAVGSTISMGKSSRGVSESDKYKFGDLSRGVVASVKGAAARGSSMRGSDQYSVGDFSAGAAVSTGEYVRKNSSRLVGAGGSAAGMIAGAAIAGPIGLVAGSFLGGSAAKMAVPDNTGDNRKLPADSRSSTDLRRSVGTNHSREFAVQNQAPDLLSGEMGHVIAGRNAVGMTAPNATNAEAIWIGDVATASQQVAMVQASVVAGPQSAAANSRYSPSGQISHASAPYNGTNRAVPSTPDQAGLSYATTPHAGTGQAASVASRQPHSNYQQGHPSYGRPAPNPGVVPQRNNPYQQNQPREQEEGYRFGDVTRGIIARGRQIDGRSENSGYRFGDFTRGLFR